MSKTTISTQKHTKSHQVTNLMNEFGMTRSQATSVIDAVVSDIESALHSGKSVQLFGIGTLYVKDVEQRKRVSPYSGEAFIMPAHKSIAFRKSKAGVARLNGK